MATHTATVQTERRPPLLIAPLSSADALSQLLAVPPELLRREQTLLAAGQRAGLALEPLGTAPLFAGHRLYPAQPHSWLLANLADDPLCQHVDGYPVPRAVLRRLQRLHRAGVEVDALYVAHELEPGRVAPGEPLRLEQLEPPSSAAAIAQARRLSSVVRWAWAMALLPLAASAIALGTATVAAVGLRASAPALDPILFGAIIAAGRPVAPGEPARWLILDRWLYDAPTE